jgi:transcriptional regulator of arginine metabolism
VQKNHNNYTGNQKKCIILRSNSEYLFNMITKKRRLATILELVNTHSPSSQGKLLKLLRERGYAITQTTLSRDIKQLKISKMPDEIGNYKYMAPDKDVVFPRQIRVRDKSKYVPNRGILSCEFSYQLGVLKTRPGHAGGIASEIDHHASSVILGTIAGDDTILIVPRENISREDILNTLEKIIPGMAVK